MAGVGEPDWVAQLDQARKGLADMAAILYGYMTALVDSGFDADQALFLTGQMQALIYATPNTEGGE